MSLDVLAKRAKEFVDTKDRRIAYLEESIEAEKAGRKAYRKRSEKLRKAIERHKKEGEENKEPTVEADELLYSTLTN